ncbi:MAG: ATP-binding protein [Desulfuromonadales bacterium]
MELWRNIRSAYKPLGGLLVIPLLGLLDLLSGTELSFSIFYLAPIFWLTWRYGLTLGIFASLLSAAVWLFAEIIAGHTFQLPWALYWNMTVRLGIFLLVTILLDKFKSNVERSRLLERLFFHDLLNLAGSLRGFIELLQDGDLQDKQQVTKLLEETTEHIIDEIETQQILSAAENRKLTVNAEYLQVRPLLDTLLAIYRHHQCIGNRNLVLSEPVDDFLLQSDPALLTRILGNLIKNALEATPPAGTVRMACKEVGDEAVFTVNNPGEIPEQVRKKIFRGRVSTKSRNRGLGLHSIQLLVDVLGGKVEVTSSSDEGTTFLVRLPKANGRGNTTSA